MIKSIHNAEHYYWGHEGEGWHLLKSDSLSVIEERMKPGTTEELHYHANTQQLFYILTGEAEFEISGQKEIVLSNESIHIPKRTLHKISNTQEEDLTFLVISEPESHGDRTDIIGYADQWKDAIKKLNVEWLEKYFAVEPIDVIQLSNPKEEIIDKGGFIYYARNNNEIIGTYSLLKISEEEYELGKMAVTEASQGTGIGNMLMKHSIIISKQRKIKNLILFSNTKLSPAIHLYKKFGYKEIPIEDNHYVRSNVKMKLEVS